MQPAGKERVNQPPENSAHMTQNQSRQIQLEEDSDKEDENEDVDVLTHIQNILRFLGKHRVTKRGPALSNPMFTLVTRGPRHRWSLESCLCDSSPATTLRLTNDHGQVVSLVVIVDCPSCYSLPHRLSSMLFSPSQTILHVILSHTDCPPCYSLPHTLSFMLFSPSHIVFHVILTLTDCPPCYSLPHRLSSILSPIVEVYL
ncbi:unnamed protein product [Ranitomeya imitator]|uniref:Uncharacterized protein n=1 Tax=Ranitomeya imitator TaxID=111125 RepID=A0ABN9M6M8_9NEOB|nr:unnamed protein product [Ranitomeya imitator]